MQIEEADRLRKQWKQLGNEPCNHSHLEKEYYLGASTGDYVCTQCGKSFDDEDRDNKKAQPNG
jgi:transposase-like protein